MVYEEYLRCFTPFTTRKCLAGLIIAMLFMANCLIILLNDSEVSELN